MRKSPCFSRRVLLLACAVALAAVCCLMTVGCGSSEGEKASAKSVVVGTLATEDILPLWVAQEEGLFEKNGLEVTVQTFQSATELIAGITSGEVDYAMTDPMVTASIFASGTDVTVGWIALGTEAGQGRFGIMTADPGIKSLKDLAGVEIGVGSNTILEYVMDKLMTAAGVDEADIVTSELQKLPVRYQAMASGQVKAAALPASLLALGESEGYFVVADDTKGDNISQSVMICRSEVLSDDAGKATDKLLRQVWDEAARLINDKPESYRGLLAQKANLSDAVASDYVLCTYPQCSPLPQENMDDVLSWMKKKGYLNVELSYDAASGTFARS